MEKWLEHYRQASGLETEDETNQTSTLFYLMREEADDILTMMGISEANKNYD